MKALCTLALAMPAVAMAQTLGLSTNLPTLGDAYTVSMASWEPSAPGGEEILFDMSSSVATGTRNYTWASPSIYSVPSDFPSATLCLVGGPNNDTLFYNTPGTGLQLVGERRNYMGLASVECPYTDGVLELKLPLAYGDTWTDGISASWTIDGLGAAVRAGTISGHADARGYLLLPGATEPTQVLRVSSTLQETVTASFYSISHRRHVVDYYSTWSRYPVYRTVADSMLANLGGLAQNTTYSEWVNASMLGVPEGVDDHAVALFPNPASEQVEVAFMAHGGALRMSVYDLQGGLLLSEDLGARAPGLYRSTFDVAALPVGMHLLRLQDAQGRMSVKRLAVVR